MFSIKALDEITADATLSQYLPSPCAVAKAKAKNTSKKSDSPKPTTPCELVHMDISIVTVPRNDGSELIIGKKNWTIRVDAATGKKWSDFTATKSEFVVLKGS